MTANSSSTSTTSSSATASLEIKDAQLMFNTVWAVLEEEYGRENLRFPKEIMWLGGAPGSGKGTNTPFITRERGLTAPPIVMSDLFDTPEMRKLKDEGKFIGDREAVELLLKELLKPVYQSGVVVDFCAPRRKRTASKCCTIKWSNCAKNFLTLKLGQNSVGQFSALPCCLSTKNLGRAATAPRPCRACQQ